MSKIRSIVSFLLLTMLHACRYPCAPGSISPAFVGFSLSDVDTFVIREYQPNSNFTDLVDTELIVPGSAYYAESNDTIFASVNFFPPGPLHSGYDWQIYIPGKNRTVSVTDIVDEQTEGNTKGCHDGFSSCKQDGQLVVPQMPISNLYVSGYFLYINNH